MVSNEEIQRLLGLIANEHSRDAYRELFLILHRPLCQFAAGILKSNYDAEEVVSDVFIHIWEKRHTLTSIESPRMYFYMSVKNRSLNLLAKQKRQQALDAGYWSVNLSQLFANPEELMMTEELMQKLRKAIQELPARCQLIFKLVKEDGLKYREVAELLQISVKTVEAQMAIALRRLSQCMQLSIPRRVRHR
ncbi:MAG: RNA polymerase sigma-70 factor [Chitinophagaceae bacterium]